MQEQLIELMLNNPAVMTITYSVTWVCLTMIAFFICKSIIEIVKKFIDKKKEEK